MDGASASVPDNDPFSATTRPGGSADVEHDINDRFAVRLDAAWTRAPMKVKSGSSQGLSFDAGHANITTIALPLVVNLNPHGTFRLHLAGGPAYGFYNMHARTGSSSSLSIFNGTRGRWGGSQFTPRESAASSEPPAARRHR